MSNLIETVAGIADYAKAKKIAHLHTQGKINNGNIITINEKSLVNFASCSYLGLEFHPNLKTAAKAAIDDFGTQFSSSRAYLSLGIYEELTTTLNQIFRGYTVVTPTTTLGHISAIPVLVSTNDLIVLDHQVHNSVQMAVQMCKAKGTEVKVIRHNNIDSLEKMLEKGRDKYEKIWYMADGIYSMYGDKAPIHELNTLLNKYKNFHLYIDDAHAMSCFGERGQGYVLSEIKITEKMVVGTSLNKAFASGGGAIICGRKDWADLIMKCGGPMITSGPMQPSNLGAALAAAKLHLSGELKSTQEKLRDNILYMHLLLERYDLPNLSEKDSPIFFIGTSLPAVAYNIIEKMIACGHYLNLGIFPAVPIKNTGIRFTLTALHTFEQIEKMVKDLHNNFNLALEEEGFNLDKIYKAFKLQRPEDKFFSKEIKPILIKDNLHVEVLDTLSEENQKIWNDGLGKNSILSAKNLMGLQFTHSHQNVKENYWEMKYIIIKNEHNEVLLSSFFTACLVKEDMLSPSEISVQIEKIRKNDPLYMTNKMVMIGCPLSEGEHIYIHPELKDKKIIFQLLLREIEKFQDETKAQSVMIRDMKSNDLDFDFFMVDQGYFKIDLPDSFSLNVKEVNINDFQSSLGKRNRKHFRENILATNSLVRTQIVNNSSNVFSWENLYKKVHNRNKEINTFQVCKAFFEYVNTSPEWEVIELRSISDNDLLGMIISFRNENSYTPVLIGLDYEKNLQFNSYRNLLWSTIKRAKELQLETINFGYSAPVEKRKFGAIRNQTCAYMQCKDNFNQEVLINESINQRELSHAN